VIPWHVLGGDNWLVRKPMPWRVARMKSRQLLSQEEIQASLASLSGWTAAEGKLSKTFAFSSYLAGIDFVRAVALAAEELDHHPDLHVTWRKVTLSVWTHSAGGLTALDFELARRAEQVVRS